VSDITPEEESELLEALFDSTVKGRVDQIWRMNRQMERCAILRSRAALEPESYNAAVRELKSTLPVEVLNRVNQREEEECIVEYEDYEYVKDRCGVPLGTPEHPFMSNPPDSPHFDPNLPNYVISPKQVTKTEFDYERLHDIIKEEAERANLTWEYTKKAPKALKIEEPLPDGLVSMVEKALVDVLPQVRRAYPNVKIGWLDLVRALNERAPPTPVLEEEVKENG